MSRVEVAVSHAMPITKPAASLAQTSRIRAEKKRRMSASQVGRRPCCSPGLAGTRQRGRDPPSKLSTEAYTLLAGGSPASRGSIQLWKTQPKLSGCKSWIGIGI